jgi:sucrose-6-phosphate hydrolase SacC (GH32 family)
MRTVLLRRLACLIALSSCCLFAESPKDRDYNQPYRPQFHFSPRINWTNDPNGLVYFEGEYHIFFQYNPFGDQWGHMSWGHAVSPDLVHWKELPVAIPESDGVMIFTGSTVVDRANSSGFCTGGKPCLVAIYTGHTPGSPAGKPLETQNLAYSNDRGRTWTKYSGNPVLDLHMHDFRDPKVFWSEQGKHWVMVVSLPDDHKVSIYGSPDLKKWEHLSDFGPEGAVSGQWECPELFELSVDGNAAHTRWVLKIGLNPGAVQGGSGEQYFVGRFDGTRFVNDNPASLQLWTDYGKDCYCALTFNGLPKTPPPAQAQPQTMIGWMNDWQYAGKLPTSPWRGQMTFPRKLALRATPDGMRLIQLPSDAIAKLHKTPVRRLIGTENEVNKHLNGHARGGDKMIDLTSTITLGTAKLAGWRLLSGDGSYTQAGYDREREELFIDRSNSGETDFSPEFPARVSAPLKLAHPGQVQLRILVDRSSIEVFAEHGRVVMTELIFPKQNGRHIAVYSDGGKLGGVSVRIWALSSIW